jgi:hypothetical protein
LHPGGGGATISDFAANDLDSLGDAPSGFPCPTDALPEGVVLGPQIALLFADFLGYLGA